MAEDQTDIHVLLELLALDDLPRDLRRLALDAARIGRGLEAVDAARRSFPSSSAQPMFYATLRRELLRVLGRPLEAVDE